VPEAPVTDKARAYWDANNAILYNAIAEDFAMGEEIQRGLASGANRELTVRLVRACARAPPRADRSRARRYGGGKAAR
jgi:hypothetical protein